MNARRSKPQSAVRVCIIGNSGSGKTTLAQQLGAWHDVASLELDGYVWSASATPTMRADHEIEHDVRSFLARHDSWIVEGCYRRWAELTLGFAPLLLFLDLTKETCLSHCQSRPWQPEKFASKSAQDLTLPFLLDWVEQYYVLDDDTSRIQHNALFEEYGGPKRRIADVAAIAALKLV